MGHVANAICLEPFGDLVTTKLCTALIAQCCACQQLLTLHDVPAAVLADLEVVAHVRIQLGHKVLIVQPKQRLLVLLRQIPPVLCRQQTIMGRLLVLLGGLAQCKLKYCPR